MAWGSSFSPALPGAYSTLEDKEGALGYLGILLKFDFGDVDGSKAVLFNVKITCCLMMYGGRWRCSPMFVHSAHGIDLMVTMNVFVGMLVQLELPNAQLIHTKRSCTSQSRSFPGVYSFSSQIPWQAILSRWGRKRFISRRCDWQEPGTLGVARCYWPHF